MITDIERSRNGETYKKTKNSELIVWDFLFPTTTSYTNPAISHQFLNCLCSLGL
jgi:hypothetical protein